MKSSKPDFCKVLIVEQSISLKYQRPALTFWAAYLCTRVNEMTFRRRKQIKQSIPVTAKQHRSIHLLKHNHNRQMLTLVRLYVAVICVTFWPLFMSCFIVTTQSHITTIHPGRVVYRQLFYKMTFRAQTWIESHLMQVKCQCIDILKDIFRKRR